MDDKQVTDAKGNAVPEHLVPVFEAAAQIGEWAKTVRQWRSEVREAADSLRLPSTYHLDWRACDTLSLPLYQILSRAMPHCVCPDCGGDGCERCDQQGWLVQAQLDTRPARDGLLDTLAQAGCNVAHMGRAEAERQDIILKARRGYYTWQANNPRPKKAKT